MNKRQKIVQEQFLNNEEAVIRKLKNQYSHALTEITKKAQSLQDEINRLGTLTSLATDEEEKARFMSMQQSKIYQKQYQDAMKKQIGSILDNMQVEEFKTVSEYLTTCYEDGFVGTMFDLQGQGIPLCFPMDQEAMVRAIQLDSKISNGLYTRLGEDVAVLKKKITSQISRGIATGRSFQEMAGQLSRVSNIGYNNAVRIARTEGHRIQVQSGMDACYKAKDKGADVVKQWDSTLDSRTRESHAMIDGQIRELDEKFSNGLMYPGDPSGGAAEVVNCRCALLQRARWAVGGSFTKMNNETGEIVDFSDIDEYNEFKKQYLNSAKQLTNNANSDKVDSEDIVVGKSVGAKAKNYDIELPNKEIVHLTEGTRVTNIKTIAGKGRDRQIDEIDTLIANWGGSESEWQKKKGLGYVDYNGESYHAELHWYEEPTAGKHKWKVKPDEDGNWFIDD